MFEKQVWKRIEREISEHIDQINKQFELARKYGINFVGTIEVGVSGCVPTRVLVDDSTHLGCIFNKETVKVAVYPDKPVPEGKKIPGGCK